jgi:disulfide bond formation protein DsbB
MPRMTVPSTRTIALATAVMAGVALGFAWVLQHWVGLAPCALCLLERWPYRVIVVLGLIAFLLPTGAARTLLWLAVLAALADVVLGVVHVGVEQHFWPSPLPECAAPTFSGGSIADMLKSMPSHPAKPCDAANYLIPGLPLSLAAMALLYAAALVLLLSGLVWQSGRHQT